MPNSNLVDERVVQMRMDNEQFEKGAEKTINTIEKLKESLKFKDTKVGDLGTSAVEKGLDAIKNKFSALEVAGQQVVRNLTDSVVNMAKQAVTGADSITPGFNKYEQQIAAVQKLMIATGESMDAVQAVSDKILKFTDETSYEYSAMLNTMSSFTSSGMGMDAAADTILGMAIAAGQAGVNAKDATHAFMGFQKAISSGYMQSANWDWIRTAGMNSAELKRQLLEAAVATGDLQKGADGTYYAIEQTAKGAKEIAVSLENFEQSFSEKWLSGEAIQLAMSRYSKAFNQVMEIHEKTGAEIFEIIAEDSPYLQYIDEYGLAAFKAGQETKTWSDAVEALKSAMSSGWMKSFELIIGNYKQASGFFSDLIEPLYQIFVEPGNRRNSFLDAAFNTSTAKYVINWDKLKKKIEETGYSAEKAEEAFQRIGSTDDEIKGLTDKYGSLEEAIKAGAVTGEQLSKILNEMGGVATTATDSMVKGAVDATTALEQYKQVALQVLNGDFGSGADRRSAIEGMGLDFDMVQWLAGNLQNGKGFDAISLEWLQTTAPNAYQHFIDVIGNGNAVIDGATGKIIKLSDVVDNMGDELSEMTGRELWQGGVLNIIHGLADAIDQISEAFNEVFGDATARGKGFRGLLETFYRFTQKFALGEDALAGIKNNFVGIFKGLKGIPSVLKSVFKGLKSVKDLALTLIDKVLSLFTKGQNVNTQFGTLGSVLGKIGEILSGLWDKVKKLFDFGGAGIGELTKKIQEFSFKDFFKPVTDFLNSDNPIAKAINKIIEPFQKLFGKKADGKDGIFGQISGSADVFAKSTDNISRSIGNLETSVNGLPSIIEKIVKIPELISNALSGGEEDETLREKIRRILGNIRKIIAEEYRNFDWNKALEAGKLGLFGVMIYRLNEFFKNLNKVVKAPQTSLKAVADAITGFTGAITGPFKALNAAITKGEKANRYLKIAMAIGVLAASIYLLCQVDTDKFLNVAMALGLLMMIMARMAKNMDGFQLFSNNTKTVSKNNPITNTIKAFENLKSAFSIDLQNAKFNLNVFSSTAQVLIGIAVAIVAIIHAFNQIRDIKSLQEVEPALWIFGSILLYLAVAIPIMTAVGDSAKAAIGTAFVIIALAIVINSIVKALMSIGQAKDINWPAIIFTFIAMITVMAMIAVILHVATGFVKQGKSFITSGTAIFAIAGVMLALGILVKSMVKTLAAATEIQNLGKGIAVLAAVMLGMVVLLTVINALASDGEAPTNMLKIAGSMLILALALGIFVPALAILSKLDWKGLLAGAAALGIVLMALTGALILLSKVDTKSLIAAAVVIGILSIFLGALLIAVAGFTVAMIGLSKLPWVEMYANFQAMHDVLAPELPLFLGLALAAALLGIGVGGIGIGFITASVGALILAVAMKKLGEALTTFGEGMPNFVKGLVSMYDTVDQNGWKVLVSVAAIVGIIALLARAIKSLSSEDSKNAIMNLGETLETAFNQILTAMKAASPKFLTALGSFVTLILTFLIALIPIAVTKVVALVVKFIFALCDAINANSDMIIAAFEALFGTLLGLALKALITAFGDFFGFIFEIIRGTIDSFVPDGKIKDFLMNKLFPFTADDFNKNTQFLRDQIDQAVDNSFMSHRHNLETEVIVTPKVEDTLASDSEFQTEMNAFKDSMGEYGTEAGGALGGGIIEAAKEAVTGSEETGEGGIAGALGGGINTSLMDVFGGEGGVKDTVMSGVGDAFGGEDVLGLAQTCGTDMSGSLFGGLTGSLTDQINIDSLKSSIGAFLGNTFGSPDTKQNFNDTGYDLGESTVKSTASGMKSDISTQRMNSAGEFTNNQAATGWNTKNEENTPIMVENMVGGLEMAFYNNPELHARLMAIGAQIYNDVEQGMYAAADMGSPSKKMAQNGVFMMQGLINGLDASSESAYNASSGITVEMLDVFQTALAQMSAILDDNLDIQPTITPVVDMSNVESAANWMNGNLGNDYNVSAEMTNGIRRLNNRAQQATPDRPNTNTGAAQDGGSGNITVNVYPSQGMDERALADKVMYRMSERFQRRRVATGV